MEKFLTTYGEGLDARLKKHLATRQIVAGQAGYDHFEGMLQKRLDRGVGANGKPLKPRRLFVMVPEENFNRHGWLLAYVNAAYTKKERERILPAKRPTFNLQMVQEGHAVSLLIYPNISKPADRPAASLSMSQPLAVGLNPMNHATTNSPASCENDILFRHGPLLSKITDLCSPCPSVSLFVKILAPVTNLYRYKKSNTAPYPPACR